MNSILTCALDVFNEFVLAFDSTSPTLNEQNGSRRITIIFARALSMHSRWAKECEYLFNEPMEVAGAAGRLLPETFRIIIYPAEGDADTIFWDVIQTIRIGGAE
jgi:hypothetical protein